jgi:hypothetical protein
VVALRSPQPSKCTILQTCYVVSASLTIPSDVIRAVYYSISWQICVMDLFSHPLLFLIYVDPNDKMSLVKPFENAEMQKDIQEKGYRCILHVWGTGDKTIDYVWKDHGIAGIAWDVETRKEKRERLMQIFKTSIVEYPTNAVVVPWIFSTTHHLQDFHLQQCKTYPYIPSTDTFTTETHEMCMNVLVFSSHIVHTWLCIHRDRMR